MIIKQFTSDTLYTIKYDFQGGVKIEASGGYHPDLQSFGHTATVPENARGLLYPICFESGYEAEEFISGDQTYENASMIIKNCKADEYMLIPVSNHRNEVTWLWTSTKKLRYIAPRSMQQFETQYADYIDKEYDPRYGAPQQYKGFDFS